MAAANGVDGSNMTDPNRIWNEASLRLRAEIGDGPFSSYIAPSAVRVDSSGQLILVTPTAYARDWVRKNALRRMNELWLGLLRGRGLLPAEVAAAAPPLDHAKHVRDLLKGTAIFAVLGLAVAAGVAAA